MYAHFFFNFVYVIFFFSLGKNKCGRKLRHVNLSGCVNISDVTLKSLSNALGSLLNTTQDSLRERDRPVSDGCCCRRQGTCGSLQGQKKSALDFDSIDQTLRDACDFVERELMACRLIHILEGGSRLSPLLEFSFLPAVMRDPSRTLSLNHWSKQKPGGSDQRKTSSSTDSWSLSVQGNQELFPLQCAVTSRSHYSGENQPRTFPSVDRNSVHRTNASPERMCGWDPHRTSSSLGRGVPQEVCDNGETDTPQRALLFLSLSGCSQITDEGLRYEGGETKFPTFHVLPCSE